ADEICAFFGCQPVQLPPKARQSENTGYSANYCYYKRLANIVSSSSFNPSGLVRGVNGKHPGFFHPFAIAGRLAAIEEKLGVRRQLVGEARKKSLADYFRESNRELQSNLV